MPAASRSLLPWDEPGAVGQHQVRPLGLGRPGAGWRWVGVSHRLGASAGHQSCGCREPLAHTSLPPQPIFLFACASIHHRHRLQYIRFLTQAKAYSQILKRLLTGERKNRFVPEDCK